VQLSRDYTATANGDRPAPRPARAATGCRPEGRAHPVAAPRRARAV